MKTKEVPRFPRPDRDAIIRKINRIAVTGRPLRTKRDLPCVLCGGSTRPIGRLAWTGAPLCTRRPCELVSASDACEIFQTPYGRAMTPGILRIFCRTLEGRRTLVQRDPLVARATWLADGYLRLLNWQRAFDEYERAKDRAAYTTGRISIVPPRRLDDVLVFRVFSDPVEIDPTASLPEPVAMMLKKILVEGPGAIEPVPF